MSDQLESNEREELIETLLQEFIRTGQPFDNLGTVADFILADRKALTKKAYQAGYDDRTLEADHEQEDAVKRVLEELRSQAVHGDLKTDKLYAHGEFVPMAVIDFMLTGKIAETEGE